VGKKQAKIRVLTGNLNLYTRNQNRVIRRTWVIIIFKRIQLENPKTSSTVLTEVCSKKTAKNMKEYDLMMALKGSF
jgi:hypothetical protein